MNEKDKQLLKDFIEYKDNASGSYIVIDKEAITSMDVETRYDGMYYMTMRLGVAGPNAYYEFGGDTALSKVMDLYKTRRGDEE